MKLTLNLLRWIPCFGATKVLEDSCTLGNPETKTGYSPDQCTSKRTALLVEIDSTDDEMERISQKEEVGSEEETLPEEHVQAPVTGEGAADFIAGIFPAEEQASAPCSDREKIAQLEAELVAAKEESADKAEEIAKLRTQVSTAEADNVRLADHLAEFLDLLEGKEAARKLVKSRSVDLQQKLTAAERELSQLKATLPAQAQRMSPEAMLISVVKSSVPTPAHLKRIKDLEQELRRQAEKAEATLEAKEKELQRAKSLFHMPAGTLVSFPEDGAQLGSGGMGTVSAVTVSFAAAAKVPHDDKAREDLCNEAAAYNAIGPCDNIARPIAWVYAPELDKDVLLVELAAGSLHGLIRDEPLLERSLLLYTLGQVLAAVVQVHGAKWLHRDIKPANFLYFDDGIIKLADFGCAAQIGSQSLARWKGTFGYMTPATVLGEARGSKLDDIRALAATMYHLLTGHDLYDDLAAQNDGLDASVKAELEEYVRAKKICTEVHKGLLVAAAEFKEHIGLEQVVPLLKDLPQKLLEAVLSGIKQPHNTSLAEIEAALEEAQEAWADDASCFEEPGCSESDHWDQSPCASVASRSIDPWGLFADGSLCMEEPNLFGCGAEEAAEGKLGSCGDAEIIFGDDGARCEDDTAADIILFDDTDDCTPATCAAKEGSSAPENAGSVVDDPYRRYYE